MRRKKPAGATRNNWPAMTTHATSQHNFLRRNALQDDEGINRYLSKAKARKKCLSALLYMPGGKFWPSGQNDFCLANFGTSTTYLPTKKERKNSNSILHVQKSGSSWKSVSREKTICCHRPACRSLDFWFFAFSVRRAQFSTVVWLKKIMDGRDY